jgi:SRSO17 transposase
MTDCTILLLLVSGMRHRSRREPAIQADQLVGGSDAVLVIDDTAVPKKGKHSVGYPR